MAASDRIGTVSPELASLAAQVKGNPGAVSKIAGVWSSAASNAAAQTQAVGSAVQTIQAEWQGTGADAFVNLMGRFDATSRQVETSLGDAAKALQSAAKTLQQVQTDVEDICEQLATEVTALQAAKKKLKNLEALIEQAAKHATGKARAKIQHAEQELSQVIAQLNSALSTAEDQYSALPVPSGSSFTPSFGSGGGGIVLTSASTPTGGVGLAAAGSVANGSAANGSAATGSGGVAVSSAGGGIPGATAGSGFENEVAVAKYLVSKGYSKAAAAGIASCIDGESGGDPESVGSGGCGLIGWTPPSTLAKYGGTCAAAGIGPGNTTRSQDLDSQMRAIFNYNNVNGNVSALNSIKDPIQAADYYSQHFERPLVTFSDVRNNVATAVFKAIGG